jgi:branched-chain amino acid transport system substrate-binding protein
MSQRSFRNAAAALLALAALAGPSAARAQAKPEPVKIGIVGPMAFIQGEDAWNGATLAAEEVNAAGGIQVGAVKRPVQLVKVDTNEILNVADAASALERAINRDKIDFALGGFRSEAALAMQEVAMDAKKIFIVCGASLDKMSENVTRDYERYKYWFRISPTRASDLVKASFAMLGSLAAQIKAELGVPVVKVALVAEKAAWTEGFVKAAQGAIPKMGMELVGVWQPSATATDVTADLTAIRNAGAHLVFTAISGPMGVPLGRQAGEMRLPAIIFGINVEAQKEGFWQATGGKANYVSTLDFYAADVELTPKTVPFVDGFRKKFGRVPTYTAATYDGIMILKAAAEAAGTLDADKLVPVIEKTDMVGTGSRLTFDKGHDVTFAPGNTVPLGVQWQDGKMVAFWPNGWQGVTFKGVKPFLVPPQMKKQ